MTSFAIAYALQAQDRLSPILAQVSKNFKNLDAQLKRTRAMLDKMSGTKLNINTTEARRKLAELQKKVTINVDTGEAMRKIRNLQNAKFGNMARMGGNPVLDKMKGGATKSNGIGAGGIIGAGGGILGIMSGVSAAREMDAAVTSFTKASNLSGKALQEFKDKAVEMESQTGMSASSILRMATEASKAGVSNSNLMKDLMLTSKVGVAFDMPAEEIATTMSQLRSAFFSGQEYAVQNDGLQKMAEMISYIADNSASSEPYIVNFMQRASGLEKVMGASKESIAAFGASFEAIGIAPEVAARAANSAQTSMAEIVSNPKILKAMHITADEFKSMVSGDVIGTMFKVISTTESMDKVTRTLTLKKMFGEGFADEMTRIGDATKIYGENIALAKDKTKQAAAFNVAYDLQMRSLNAQLDRVSNGFKTIMANSIAPFLTVIAAKLAGAIEWAKEHPTLTKYATGLFLIATAASVAAIALAVLKNTSKTLGLASVFEMLPKLGKSAGGAGMLARMGTMFTGLGTGMAAFAGRVMLAVRSFSLFSVVSTVLRTVLMGVVGGIGFLLSPIGLVIAAIVSAAVLIYKYWLPIKAFFVGVFQGISAAIAPLASTFETAFKPFAPVFDWISKAISGVVTWFGSFFTQVQHGDEKIAGFTNTGRSLGEIIGQAFTGALTPLWLIIDAVNLLWASGKWLFGGKDAKFEFTSTTKKVFEDLATPKNYAAIDTAKKLEHHRNVANKITAGDMPTATDPSLTNAINIAQANGAPINMGTAALDKAAKTNENSANANLQAASIEMGAAKIMQAAADKMMQAFSSFQPAGGGAYLGTQGR
jgi:TP901 family phage tail tape measure protein